MSDRVLTIVFLAVVYISLMMLVAPWRDNSSLREASNAAEVCVGRYCLAEECVGRYCPTEAPDLDPYEDLPDEAFR